MTTADILLIESGRANAPSFAPALEKKGYRLAVYHKIDNALAAAEKKPPDLIILDAASMKTSGTRLCRKARAKLDSTPIILVAPVDTRPDPGSGASLILVHPFTPRKLLNRVARLLPGDESYTLETGPIKLNLAQCKVRCLKKESRLTPKQAQLLEVFMHNPGRLMTRKKLIRQIWHTDYTGDTRTLDVHMSWLRYAIEPDPKKPRFLKTIRGMGYRLDIPEGK
jgi:DNA-binding response OmpR family regulator